jgi:hypothetical protein
MSTAYIALTFDTSANTAKNLTTSGDEFPAARPIAITQRDNHKVAVIDSQSGFRQARVRYSGNLGPRI